MAILGLSAVKFQNTGTIHSLLRSRLSVPLCVANKRFVQVRCQDLPNATDSDRGYYKMHGTKQQRSSYTMAVSALVATNFINFDPQVIESNVVGDGKLWMCHNVALY